jgi:hypothetical protein
MTGSGRSQAQMVGGLTCDESQSLGKEVKLILGWRVRESQVEATVF